MPYTYQIEKTMFSILIISLKSLFCENVKVDFEIHENTSYAAKKNITLCSLEDSPSN